ncbi:MAG: hypothetical protein ACOCRX_01270 [Candidatus Woesearchaeota archaeon]
MSNKPECKLIGEDGNIFNLVGKATKALKRANLKIEAEEMTDRVFKSDSYSYGFKFLKTDYRLNLLDKLKTEYPGGLPN